jgi:hypothetical protein
LAWKIGATSLANVGVFVGSAALAGAASNAVTAAPAIALAQAFPCNIRMLLSDSAHDNPPHTTVRMVVSTRTILQQSVSRFTTFSGLFSHFF